MIHHKASVPTRTRGEVCAVCREPWPCPTALADDDQDLSTQSVDGPNGLRVKREQCSTCIFRPGNPIDLRPGRVQDMTSQTDRLDTNVICHQTLDGEGALCKGSVDRRPGQMFRIASRLRNSIEWVD